jgi:hypothetical protein
VDGGRGADARANTAVTWNEIPEPCALDNKGVPKYLEENNIAFCHWSRCDGGAGGHGIIQLMVPDPENDLEMIGYPDPGGDKLQYLSVLANEYPFGHLPDQEKYMPPQSDCYWARYVFDVENVGGTTWKRIWPKTADCLVDPEKVVSTINPQTYAVSKWIDMGQVTNRPLIGGKTAPVFFNNGYHGFRGITPGFLNDTSTELWGLVYEENGFVILDPSGENDIDVSSPDLYEADFIDETNRIGIQFQATDAVIPGSKVPDEDAATPWTTMLNELYGKQFIRFKIGLNAAYDTTIKASSIKPQVDRVRLRFRY